MRLGNRHLAAKITAMQEAAKHSYSDTMHEEETPGGNTTADHLKLNNVLAIVTDKIVCATVTSDDIRSISLDATNKTKSPPKSKCGSVVSSPDSETPLHEIISQASLRTGVASLSKSVNDLGRPCTETSGRSHSEDSPVTATGDQQLQSHKARESDDVSDAGFGQVDLEMASTCKKCSSGDGSRGCHSKKRGNVGKLKNNSSGGGGGGSGSGGKKRNKRIGDGDVGKQKECNKYVESKCGVKGEAADDGQPDITSAKSTHSQSSSEGASPNNTGSNNRNLKSGHARTHAIVINLDDKNQLTEEVTV
jgi:hypothetical protein